MPVTNRKFVSAWSLRFCGAALLSLFVLMIATTDSDAATKCTIKGTNGPDRLFGKKGRDVICGFGGADRLVGLGGNDILMGGKGKDRLNGVSGNDRLLGGKGDDNLVGGDGNDSLYGQPQDDRLYGGSGDDLLDGGEGTNYINGGSGQNRCLEGAADTLAGTCDNTAPELTALSFSPASVDTWEEGKTVTMTYSIKDDKSGIFQQPMPGAKHEQTGQTIWSWSEKLEGDEHAASYTSSFNVPRYSAQGHWDVWINVRDNAGNYTQIGPAEMAKLGFPSGFEQTGQGDSVKPRISEISFDRTVVDTSSSSQLVHVRARVTDDLTGVGPELSPLSNPVGVGARKDPESQFANGTLYRVSGDKLDGIWEGDLVMGKYSAKGAWKLMLSATDAAGNSQSLLNFDLAKLGLPSEIQQVGAGDTTAPMITEISVTPSNVDTTNGPQTVSLRYRMVDDLAGNTWGGNSAPLYSNGVQTPLQIDTTRTSGDYLNGVYEGSVVLPKGSTQGNWSVQIAAFDDAGNGSFYDAAKFTAAGLNGSFHNGP